MNCNSGLRKDFADDLVASVAEISRKHGLTDIAVHRETDPVVVAARGCLGKDKEAVEMVLQVSPDIARADRVSLAGADVTAEAAVDVHRAFDLSAVVAAPAAAAASPMPERDPCAGDDDANVVK